MLSKIFSNRPFLARISLLSGLGLAVACGSSTTPEGGAGGSGGSTAGQAGNGGVAGNGGTAGQAGDGGIAGDGGLSQYLSCTMTADLGNGIIKCEEGILNRTTASSCEDKKANYVAPIGCDTISCDGPLSFCANYETTAGLPPDAPDFHCVTGCLVDSDCGDNQICQCGDPIGQCVDASCSANSDCKTDELCVANPAAHNGCFNDTSFQCMSAKAACTSNADCTNENEYCNYKEDGSSVCEIPACVI